MYFTREQWDAAPLAEKERAARRLAKELPTGFSFDSVRRFELGPSRHDIAIFRYEDAEFSLIPGGQVTLGWDPNRPWEPNVDEAYDAQGLQEQWGITDTFEERIQAVTLPLRTVEFSPFLIETTASEPGWEYSGEYDTYWEACKSVTSGSGRGREGKNGRWIAERFVHPTHADLVMRLKTSGFRLPSSDEWEFVCGCGSPTLFRWGDHAPCDRMPTETDPEEVLYARQWVPSEPPPRGFAVEWEDHRLPNGFGVKIAFHPYQREVVAQAGTLRGGDGGGCICGPAGCFNAWLTLSTAYFDPRWCNREPTESLDPYYIVSRRLLELD